MRPQTVLLYAFALLSAAMLGLAAGAVWMVVTMYAEHPVPWLALLVGALLAWSIRLWIRPRSVGAAALAALATALAAIYLNMLLAAVRIAGNFDMGLTDALRTAGFEMLLALARLGIRPIDVFWYVLAILLAAWLNWHKPRRKVESD